MDKIIEFRHTNFSYNGTNSFNDFNMAIDAKDIVSIIGPAGSGKTTLLKMLCHKLPNETCYFDGQKFSSYNKNVLKKSIVVIFDSPFFKDTVKSELLNRVSLLDYDKDEINSRYEEFIEFFCLKKDENKNLDRLSYSKQYLIKILRYLIIIPKVVAIDNLLINLTKKDKERVIDYIKKHKITLINITTDMNETLYSNKIFVMENFVVIMEGPTLTVLQADTVLKRLGFKLPLPVQLSIELGNYEVLDKIYTSNEKLVKELWK